MAQRAAAGRTFLKKLDLTKIEQLGSGAVYCQVIDVVHPGSISLQKVNWKARNNYEFIANLKILQNAFDKAGIKRYVEVSRLCYSGREACQGEISGQS